MGQAVLACPLRAAHSTWGHRCATSAAALYLLAIRPRFGELGLDYADEDRQLAHLRRRTAAAIDRCVSGPTHTVSRELTFDLTVSTRRLGIGIGLTSLTTFASVETIAADAMRSGVSGAPLACA